MNFNGISQKGISQKGISQKGISLIESLIALSILLFAAFAVLITFHSLLSKGITLNKSIIDNQGTSNAIMEYKNNGVIDSEKYNVGLSAGNNKSYTLTVSTKDNAESSKAIVTRPIAKINFVNCNLLSCTFNGDGSSAFGDIYKYNAGNSSAEYSTDSGVSFSNEDNETNEPTSNIVIKYNTAGSYTVVLIAQDVFGFNSQDTFDLVI